MWDRTLIESKGFDRRSKRWWTVPLAAGLHVALIVAALFASYWHVEAIEAPLEKIKYVHAIPIVISPPPNVGVGRTQPANKNPKETKIPELMQPTQVLPLAREPKVYIDDLGPESHFDIDPNAPSGPGRPDGVPGGVPDGTRTGSAITGMLSEDEPIVMHVGIAEPVLISRVEPEYPRAALIARAQGMVILEAIITKTGTVEQIKTLRADNAHLEKAAIDAVLNWKYRPAKINNQPVKVYFTVTVIFKLK